eukprot:3777109-Rhodomonas_salina.1
MLVCLRLFLVSPSRRFSSVCIPDITVCASSKSVEPGSSIPAPPAPAAAFDANAPSADLQTHTHILAISVSALRQSIQSQCLHPSARHTDLAPLPLAPGSPGTAGAPGTAGIPEAPRAPPVGPPAARVPPTPPPGTVEFPKPPGPGSSIQGGVIPNCPVLFRDCALEPESRRHSLLESDPDIALEAR